MPLELLFNPIMKATNNLGVPIALARANYYAAGSSSIRQDTYADAGQVTKNPNPMIADSNGLFGPAFLLPLAYHLVITDPTGTITYFDQDNIAGASYSVLFDNTWQLKENVDPSKILNIELSGLTTNTTRTWTAPDASGIVLLSTYGVMGAATFQFKRGSDIVAANDITLPTNGNMFAVTGATQINRINSPASFQTGTEILLWFQSTPTVKHNQGAGSGFYPVLLNGSADFTAAANMMIRLCMISANSWIEVPRRS